MSAQRAARWDEEGPAAKPPGIVVLTSRFTDKACFDVLFAQVGLTVGLVPETSGEPVVTAVRGAALVLLDLAGDRDRGFEMLTRLRRGGVMAPVVVIGATRDEALALQAFDAGADAVLPSPLDPLELVARCRALLRRSPEDVADDPEPGRLRLDQDAGTAYVGAEGLNLSAMQFAVLEQLARRPGQVLTRQLLLDQLYRGIDTPTPAVIDFYIHALRRQLAASQCASIIETVRGVGFRLATRPDADPGNRPPTSAG